jgi:hypothetical protein
MELGPHPVLDNVERRVSKPSATDNDLCSIGI